MPNATPSPTRMIRQVLEARMAELRTELRAAQGMGELTQAEQGSNDTKDLAERLQHEEIGEVQQKRVLAELAANEAALRHLDAGTYGICIDCGTAIGQPRLQLLPAALRCAACQRTHEQHGA